MKLFNLMCERQLTSPHSAIRPLRSTLRLPIKSMLPRVHLLTENQLPVSLKYIYALFLKKKKIDKVTDEERVDMLSEELSNESSVWSIYVSTAANYDTEMIDGWNKNLDVLLLFVSISYPRLFIRLIVAARLHSSPLS